MYHTHYTYMNLEQGELFSPQKKSSDTEHRYGNLALNENEDQKNSKLCCDTVTMTKRGEAP